MTRDKRENGKLVWIVFLNGDYRSLRKGNPVSHLAEIFVDHSVAGQMELYLLTGRDSLLKERKALKTIARALKPDSAQRGFPVRMVRRSWFDKLTMTAHHDGPRCNPGL